MKENKIGYSKMKIEASPKGESLIKEGGEMKQSCKCSRSERKFK